MKIKCPICGHEFHTMTPLHANTHGMTLHQFKKAYPGFKFFSVCPVILKPVLLTEYAEYTQDVITRRMRRERR
jgi:hypothetical protein